VPRKQQVFLSGTRKVERLPGEVTSLIQELIDSDVHFIVGDAPGCDRAFQRHLASLNQSQVRVFSSAPYVRNNLGNWPSEFIDSGLKSKTNAMHAAKDRRMAELCDLGVMIWDGQSAGTLANLLDVISQGKSAYLYNYLDNEFVKFDGDTSLSKYLDGFPEVRDMAAKRLKRDKKRSSKLKVDSSKTSETLF
jgi:hypothetical protein